MINFSFTITPQLKTELIKIDSTRALILQQLMARGEELELRLEANLDRITSASRMGDKRLLRSEVSTLLYPSDKKKSTVEPETSGYLSAYEWINQAWYMERAKVQTADIQKLYSFFPKKPVIDEAEVKQILDFTQVNPEHPIVQAGLIFILFSQALPKDSRNIRLSLLASNIFLYKNGYDFRGTLNLEEYIAGDLPHFKDLVSASTTSRNLSSFLEYFTQAVSLSSEASLRRIESHESKHDMPTEYYELTDRQKEILMLLVKPDVKISNKTIQKRFKVSQITASRDLAKLHTLGLIFSAGKGRSVYYTKL